MPSEGVRICWRYLIFENTVTEEDFFDRLTQFMLTTRSNKRYGKDAMEFERLWVTRLIRMMRELSSRVFRISDHYTFLVSVPKWREIFATIFEGRIADTIICVTLKPYIDKELHTRTFNNRKNMGMQAAVNQVIEDIYEVSEGCTKPCRIIKWDIKGCFPNARLDFMAKCYYNIIDKYHDEIAAEYGEEWPDFVRWLVDITIYSNPTKHCERRTPKFLWDLHITLEKSLFGKEPGIGTPIGRWVSQTGMGLYLNDEIKWLNDDCLIHATLFMDDCAEVVPEEIHQYALSKLPELRQRLEIKGLKLNEKKFYDQPYQHGLEFLGIHIKPGRLHLNDCTYNRCLEKIKEFNKEPNKYEAIDSFICTVNSYTGQLKGLAEYKRLQEIKSAINKEWWRWLEWNEKRFCVVCKEGYTFNERLNIKYNLKIKKYDKRRNPVAH